MPPESRLVTEELWPDAVTTVILWLLAAKVLAARIAPSCLTRAAADVSVPTTPLPTALLLAHLRAIASARRLARQSMGVTGDPSDLLRVLYPLLEVWDGIHTRRRPATKLAVSPSHAAAMRSHGAARGRFAATAAALPPSAVCRMPRQSVTMQGGVGARPITIAIAWVSAAGDVRIFEGSRTSAVATRDPLASTATIAQAATVKASHFACTTREASVGGIGLGREPPESCNIQDRRRRKRYRHQGPSL